MPMRLSARLWTIALCAAFAVASLSPLAEAQEPAASGLNARRLPPPRPSDARPRPERDADTVLVRYTKETGKTGRDRALARHRATDRGGVRGTAYSLVAIEGSPETAVRELESEPSIVDAQLNYLRRASAVPNDPAWYYGDQDYLKEIRMASAWNASKGTTAQTIAVIDTGIDLDHPEFTGRRKVGYNAFTNGTNVADDNGHGTFVSGVAAAATNNNRGIAGVAWNAGILPVKVLNADGEGTDAVIAEGITWAVDHGARVLNLSLGGPGTSPVLKSAIDYALSRDRVVVAAAGNEGWDVKSYPAAYKGVVAVSATDPESTFAYFSNHGWWVDLAAPGMEIISTMAGDAEAYAIGDGTSFASPVVAGIAFLLRVQNPSWTRAQVFARLRSTARDAGPSGIDPFYGSGRVDAGAALGLVTPLEPIAPAPGFASDGTIDRARVMLGYSLGGDISPEGDVDWYARDFPTTGEATFTLTPPTYYPSVNRALEMDPVLEVYGPDLDLLARRDAGYLNDPETITVPVRTPGRYYARVSNFLGSRSPGRFTLSWSFTQITYPPDYAFAPQIDRPGLAASTGIADVTGDGRADVLMTRHPGGQAEAGDGYFLDVFPGNADGTLQTTPTVLTTHG
ncbi:MAG: S8 family peptidase, partial [Actinobacteria bacterium]|nr:S8 family peptidase [Actinomycetota bacterium]